jgi:inner membrane protein involved in colicin E2 resistance
VLLPRLQTLHASYITVRSLARFLLLLLALTQHSCLNCEWHIGVLSRARALRIALPSTCSAKRAS